VAEGVTVGSLPADSEQFMLIEELYKQKEDIKKEIIEEIEGIIKANKNNIYCDHYQLQDMIEEIFKLYA